jgi:hypothetical protein
MSLMDALLLDPFEMEVWVTPRTDGVLGSGTEDDPFDGTLYSTPALTVTGITGTNSLIATATTATNHGFQSLQVVQISGVVPNYDSNGKPFGASYNGLFVITNVLTPTKFQYTMRMMPAQDVSGPGVTCQLDKTFFDAVMRSLPMQVLRISNDDSSPPVATVTAIQHGFVVGQTVMIVGATGSFAQSNNGSFVISNVVSLDQFKYTARGGPNQGTVSGNLFCRLNVPDAAARGIALAPPVALVLGPGTLQTKGSAPIYVAGWMPRSKMKMVGSGMEVSVLQLVAASVDNLNQYTAVGSAFGVSVDGFEARDFTVDCNIAGQPSQLAACGAIIAGATRSRLRRIRAINWGTQTPPSPVGSGIECFPLAVGGALFQPSFDGSGNLVLTYIAGEASWIDDCIVEQPGLNNSVETTCLSAGGGIEQGELMVYSPGCGLRRSYVNCEYRKNPVPIASMTYIGSGQWQVTTALPHRLPNNTYARISGIMVSGQPYYNSFNGSYVITGVSTSTPTQFNYTPFPAQTNANAVPFGDMWVGKWPSQGAPIAQITSFTRSSGPAPWKWTYTVGVMTGMSHFLTPNNIVNVNGVTYTVPGNPDTVYTDPEGAFTVAGVTDSTHFTYTFPSNNDLSGGSVSVSNSAAIGTDFQVFQTYGTAAIVEGNHASNCGPGLYHDTWNTRDHIFRNNYLRRVVFGSYQNLGGVVSTAPTVVYLLQALTSSVIQGLFTATATTKQEHGFSTNDQVTISGAAQPVYNGTFAITGVTLMTFNYTISALEPPDTGAPAYQTAAPMSPQPWAPTAQQRILSSLSYALQNGVYLATAQVDLNIFPDGHGLNVGETVFISKANFTESSPPQSFSGYFVVTAVLDTYPFKKFQFVIPPGPNLPVPPPNGSVTSNSGYYGRLWTGGIIVEENNVIEQAPPQSYFSIGADAGSVPSIPPVLFPEVLWRRNVIRATDGLADPPASAWTRIGLDLQAAGGAIVEENVVDATDAHHVVDAPDANAVRFSACATAQFFANQTAAGGLIQGFNNDTKANVSELSNVEDAAILAI